MIITKDIYWGVIKKYIPIGLFLFLIIITLVIPGWFISQEKYFYYWDYGGYQSVASYQVEKFSNSPLAVLRSTINSMSLEYNYLYTIPLIPFMLLLGNSRMSYVMSVSMLYQLPFALVLAVIGTQLNKYRGKSVFWSTAILCLLTPIGWIPALRGYPDVGAALLLATAVSLYIANSRSAFSITSNLLREIRRWWQPVVIGFLLAAAVLFRRHFTYEIIAFVVAVCLDGLLPIFYPDAVDGGEELANEENQNVSKNNAKRKGLIFLFINHGSRVGLIGVAFILFLFTFGRSFLINVIRTDYSTLFSSYTLPSMQVLWFFISSYGWITCILVGLGFSLGLFTGLFRFRALFFVLVYSSISLLLWLVLAKQAGIHYTLHFTPFIILGIASFGWVIFDKLKGASRIIILSGFTIFVTVNLIVGFLPLRLNPQLSLLRYYLFSSLNAPLIRADYQEVVHLVTYLRSLSSHEGMIYVVDSSGLMNFDLLRKAEEVMYNDRRLNIGVTPQIDSRDFYPLELLMKAEYVILTSPIQFHLSNPQEQKVVEVVYKIFTERSKVAQDFRRLQEQFNLAGGAILSIYQRLHPSSIKTAVQSFAYMRSFIGRRPGRQSDWMVLDSPLGTDIVSQMDGNMQMVIPQPSGEGENQVTLLYSEEITGHIKIQGDYKFIVQPEPYTLDNPQAEIGVKLYNSTGEIVQERSVKTIPPPITSKTSISSWNMNISLKQNESDQKDGEHFMFQFNLHEPYYLVFYVYRTYQINDSPMIIEWSFID